jgi:hypothetical protein
MPRGRVLGTRRVEGDARSPAAANISIGVVER